MQPKEATVFVIDDDPEVRGALQRLMRSEGWRVEAFAAAQEFLDAAPAEGVGCILLDVNMPGMTGPQLQEHLGRAGVGIPVIFLTGQCSVSMGVQAMKNGAVDFLEKPIDADALMPAIERAVATHRRTRDQGLQLAEIQHRLEDLSARERQVFNLVVLGRLNKQIAGELGIAEKTVKVHRGRVMSKMKVRSVAQLVHLYEQVLAAEAATA